MDEASRQRIDDALARLSRGERAAFDEAFALVEPALSKFIALHLREPDESADALQNTLLKVFSRVSDYRPGTNALAWVFTLAAFEIATVRRRRLRHERQQLQLAASPIGGGQPSSLEPPPLLQLDRLLEQLSPEDRSLLLPDDGGPRAPRERKRKQRALERLKNLWRSIHGND